jgi:hypothetical protein
MTSLREIKDMLADGSMEFRDWLNRNHTIESYRDLDYDQSRLATVSGNDSPDAIEQMIKATLSEKTIQILKENSVAPSLFEAIRLLEKRRKKNKL